MPRDVGTLCIVWCASLMQDAAVAAQVMHISMNGHESVLSHGSAIVYSGFEEDPDAAGANMEAHLMRLLGHAELISHRPRQ